MKFRPNEKFLLVIFSTINFSLVYRNEKMDVSTAAVVSTQANTTRESPDTPEQESSTLGSSVLFTDIGLTSTPETRVLENLVTEDDEDGYNSNGVIGPFFDQVKDELTVEYEEGEVVAPQSVSIDRNVVMDRVQDPNCNDEDMWTVEEVMNRKYKNKDM